VSSTKKTSQKVEYALPKVEIAASPSKLFKAATPKGLKKGLTFERKLTDPAHHPYDTIEWEKRASVIRDEKGNVIHEIKNLEVPKSWSQLATDIIAFKYLRKRGVLPVFVNI